ncbi:MAG: multifunctional CCA addition/repair protein [Halobacteriovoraceae bacterium]|nr:multifunctional CCA addition/repair protein [Halobacteriovoraceae bacterium]
MKIYLVGGAVRDELLGREVQDRDYLVVGSSPSELLKLGYNQVGKSFPVFLHPITKEEYALARKETKISSGHDGFQFNFSPNISLEEDLVRRDFTINAMAKKDDQIIDLFNGQKDLKDKILRHVSEHFIEDPLRVLRGARFCAQLGFSLHHDTQKMMQKISQSGELQTLSGERVLNEIELALKSPNPEIFFKVLDQVGALSVILPELSALKGVPQNPKYHPEGDAWIHTLLVLEACSKITTKIECRWAALLHDLGKALTPKDVLPSHRGHELAGLIPIKELHQRIKPPKSWQTLALTVCEFHLKSHFCLEMRAAKVYQLLKDVGSFRSCEKLEDFLICCIADDLGKLSTSYPQADFLRKCFQEILTLDLEHLQARYQGQELGEQIRKAQINSIQSLIKSM